MNWEANSKAIWTATRKPTDTAIATVNGVHWYTFYGCTPPKFQYLSNALSVWVPTLYNYSAIALKYICL